MTPPGTVVALVTDAAVVTGAFGNETASFAVVNKITDTKKYLGKSFMGMNDH
jgi:hypothetical protein